ncbi:hypothetical protein HFD88_009536 [Aspergillus terreus]|nr:hypothetical protein HFD88_009536 [Aspergillus terreus]
MAQADSDDSISVTSTVLSEEQSEYEVDTILAEDNSGDETYYLVKWLGYPEERCTWEPADSFSTEETLRDWAAKKRSIADGKLTPFDTDAWQARVEALEAQKQERKRRRQAKRRRLGLLNAGIAPVGATPISGASKVNALSTKVNTEAGTSNKRTAPESPVHGREREQKRVSISIPSRPRPKPPPVLFGSSKSRPAPGPARAQRPHNPDSFKRFNLSTQRRYEKAKKDEPPPNTGQLEMFRPSEFPARSGANLAALGSRGLRRPEGSAAQGSPRAPTADTQAEQVLANRTHSGTFQEGDLALTRNEYTDNQTLVKSKRLTPQLNIWFQHLSTLADYQTQCDSSRNDVICNGWVEGFDHTEPSIYRFAKELMQKNLVAIACPDSPSHDAYLLYPPETRDFGFLGCHAKEPPDFSLRIAVKRSTDFFEQPALPAEAPRTPSMIQTAPPDKLSHSSNRPEPPRRQLSDDVHFNMAPSNNAVQPSRSDRQGLAEQQLKTNRSNSPVTSAEYDISPGGEPMDISDDDEQSLAVSNKPVMPPSNAPENAREVANEMFLQMFGVTFEMLATVDGNPKSPYSDCFYIMLPRDPSAAKEWEILRGFLKANGALVYSNIIDDDWDKFLRISPGVILVHDSHMCQFSEPWFKELTRRSSWRYSLSNTPGQANFQRLFPMGGVILITEDFMIRRPEGILIFLDYFYCMYFKGRYPGTWKVMFRPDVLNWLMTLYEKDKGPVWLALYWAIMRLNKSTSTDLPDGISNSLSESAVISPRSIPHYGFRTEEHNPDIPKDLSQEQRNADHLVELFAGWALLNCHRFRKFYVLTHVPPLERWNSWCHIGPIIFGEKQLMKEFKIKHKYHWDRLRGQKSTGDSEQQQPHTPFEPRTPKTPAKPPSHSDGATPADPRCRATPRNYPQPYQ